MRHFSDKRISVETESWQIPIIYKTISLDINNIKNTVIVEMGAIQSSTTTYGKVIKTQ